MCSLTINDFISQLTSIQTKSTTNAKEAKTELQELLFSSEVYNSSEVSNDDIQAKINDLNAQIETLEAQIEAKEAAAEKEQKSILQNNDKVAAKQSSLEDAISDAISATQEANIEAQNELAQKISDAQQSVISRYLNGNLDVDPQNPEAGIANAIQNELGGIAGSVSPDLSSANHSFAQVDSITREIGSLLNIISTQSSVLNSLKSDISILKSQVSVLKLTKSTYEQMQELTNTSGNNSNLQTIDLKSLFSSSKTDFLNGLKTDLKVPVKGANAKTGVAAADADNKNEQLVAMGEAIDVDGENSIVKQMADEGFTFEEASKALAWLFDDSGIAFDSESGSMLIPNGDDNEAESIYSSLADQMKQYWGADANIDRTADFSNNNQDFLSATSSTIGFHLDEGDNNYFYNFVVDYNNDGIFNGENEFLGAGKDISSFTDGAQLSDDDKQAIKNMFGDKISFALWGENLENLSGDSLKSFDLNNDGKISDMESLFMMDLNKDGSINGDELDNMMFLKTNENSLASSFTDADSAGITNIDLTQYMQDGKYSNSLLSNNAFRDINGNLQQNSFGLTVKGKNVTGAQNLNSTEYNNTMFLKLYNNNFKISFDENIFNEINEATTPEDFVYTDYAEEAALAFQTVTEEGLSAKSQQRSLVQSAKEQRTGTVETARANASSVASSVAQPPKQEEEPVEGDVNGDGKITIEDGDYNEDGVVNSFDEEFLAKLQKAQEEQKQ